MLRSLAGVSTLLFIGVAVAVGARLLLLALRTRGLPELSLGAGLLVIVGLGYPATLAGRGGAVDAPESARWLIAFSAFAMAAGWTGVWVFTWRVFRADSKLATSLTLSCIAGMFAYAMVAAHEALTIAHPAGLDFGELKHLGVSLLAVLVNAWAAWESLGYYAKMRRRVAVGLGDPVVANRFLLWALVMGFSMVSLGVPTAASSMGIDVVTSPPVLLSSAVTGVCCSATLWLAFLPPRAYVERLRATA